MSQNQHATDNSDMTLSVMFPSKYLKCSDLQGRNVPITISKVTIEDVPMTGGKKERKCVLSLAKTKKQLVIGKTNGYALGVLISSNAKTWEGKKITLCPDVTMFGKKKMPCIRIIGSSDAPPERAAAYARAWIGDRMGGELVSRLKRELGLLELNGVPVTEKAALEPMESPVGDDPSEPDMFADAEDETVDIAKIPTMDLLNEYASDLLTAQKMTDKLKAVIESRAAQLAP